MILIIYIISIILIEFLQRYYRGRINDNIKIKYLVTISYLCFAYGIAYEIIYYLKNI